MKTIDDVISFLNKVDENELADEDIPADIYGGNFDDCFWGGFDCGRYSLAKELLRKLGQ